MYNEKCDRPDTRLATRAVNLAFKNSRGSCRKEGDAFGV